MSCGIETDSVFKASWGALTKEAKENALPVWQETATTMDKSKFVQKHWDVARFLREVPDVAEADRERHMEVVKQS